MALLDLFLPTGEHMILTEEGWQSGQYRQAYVDGLEEGQTISAVIFDEAERSRAGSGSSCRAEVLSRSVVYRWPVRRGSLG